MYLSLIKKTAFFLSALLAMLGAKIEAKIDQIESIEVLEEKVQQLPKDSLVVFDVDEVIFTDQDAILKPVGDPLKFQIFNERYAKADTQSEKDLTTIILSLPLTLAKKELVESRTPQLIKKLQEKGIKVIALTSCPTRPFGIIKDFEKWRLGHIDDFGIDFSKSFPDQKRFVFENITSYNVPPPVYNQGVIFAEGFSKAAVLSAFLQKINYKPSEVVFIDDMFSNLQQMQDKLAILRIPFHGFYYVKVEKDSAGGIDEEIARFQFDYLFKNQKWLSDQEAKNLIESQKK